MFKLSNSTLVKLTKANKTIDFEVIDSQTKKIFKSSLKQIPQNIQHYDDMNSLHDMLMAKLKDKSMKFVGNRIVITDKITLNGKQKQKQFDFPLVEEKSENEMSKLYIEQQFASTNSAEKEAEIQAKFKQQRDKIDSLERRINNSPIANNSIDYGDIETRMKRLETSKSEKNEINTLINQLEVKFTKIVNDSKIQSDARIKQLEAKCDKLRRDCDLQSKLLTQVKNYANGWYFEDTSSKGMTISRPIISMQNVTDEKQFRIWKDCLGDRCDQILHFRIIRYGDCFFNLGFMSCADKQRNKQTYKGLSNIQSVFFNVKKGSVTLISGGIHLYSQAPKEAIEQTTLSFLVNSQQNIVTAFVNNREIKKFNFPNKMRNNNNYPFVFMTERGQVEVQTPAPIQLTLK